MSTKLKMYVPLNQRLLDLNFFSMVKRLLDKYYDSNDSENSIEYKQFSFPETYKSLNKLMDEYEAKKPESEKLSYEERCFLFARLYSIKGFSTAVVELGKIIGMTFSLQLKGSDGEFHNIKYSDEDKDLESKVVLNVRLNETSYEDFIAIKGCILDAIRDLLWYVDPGCKISVDKLNLNLDFTTENNLTCDAKIITQCTAIINT